jgi:redox-sensing transcriptional repressor
MKKRRVSEQIIRRLPRYYRYLEELSDNGVTRISSKELGEMMNLTASQIRQDLNCFGGFGQQGFGYHVDELKKEIMRILGLGRLYSLIVVGAGNIGQALIKYSGFLREGFDINAVFDNDSEVIGTKIKGIKVRDVDTLEEYAKDNKVDIAILTVNQASAMEVAHRLKECGITNVWNFTPKDIRIDGMIVENASLSDTLFMLCFRMNELSKKGS